jgi:hypothetical protein
MSESLSVKKLNGFKEESEIPCPPSSGKWVSIDEWQSAIPNYMRYLDQQKRPILKSSHNLFLW